RDFEALIFVQPQPFVAQLEPMLKASGGAGAEQQIAELKKIEAVTMATKIEGEQMHDTMFVLQTDASKRPALARGALALTSTDTLLFYDARLQMPKDFDLKKNPALASAAAEIGGAWFGWLEKLTKELGATGGELGVQLDMPTGVMQPGVVVSIETRDTESATKLADAIAASPSDAGAWKRQDLDGVPLYKLQLTGLA